MTDSVGVTSNTIDGVARIVLDRGSANTFDLDMARALSDAVVSIAADPATRAVVLQANGRMFSAGGDLASFVESVQPSRAIRDVTLQLHNAVAVLHSIDAPVVAAVRGSAAGAGLSLVLGADLVIASAATKFVLGYSAIGLSPDAGATWWLPRLVGYRRAVQIALLNPVIGGVEALDIGLISEVVDDDSIDRRTDELARQLASGPTIAFAAARRLMREGLTIPLETQLARESATIGDCLGSDDGMAGVRAFLSKATPVFTGT